MKLEFNPKGFSGVDVGAIYVLDEPGSYLHASAQEKLCKKLKQLSQKNVVIYCTHSHHLLNPEVIPFSTIKISEKDGLGEVRLYSVHEYSGTVKQRQSAFQPIHDALHIAPFSFEFGKQRVLIVEGIVDYYLFDMFRGDKEYRVLPGVGADSVLYQVSLMIAWGVDYRVVWDNDESGRKSRDKAIRSFGPVEGGKRFWLLPLIGKRRKTIIQDFVDSQDLRYFRDFLQLPKNASFDKTITAVYHDERRSELLSSLPGKTAERIEKVLNKVVL